LPQVPVGPRREPFYRLVQAGFRQRRKQLHNALGRELPIPRPTLSAAFAACGIDSERRAQTLTLAEWACLHERLEHLLAERPVEA
jgi:16S rRNA (adenine1518-N6/adenine1519-N6)-dimethyltransferase